MNALADKVLDLLKKQKRVAGMVHNQSMPRQAIVKPWCSVSIWPN
jgi:hypothetical protein